MLVNEIEIKKIKINFTIPVSQLSPVYPSTHPQVYIF